MLTFKHLAIEFGAAEVHMMFSPPRVWKQSCRDEQRTNKDLLPINIPVRLWPQSIFSAVGCQKSRLGRGKLVELRMREPSSGEGLVSSSDAHLTDHKRCRGLSTEPKMREREQLDGDYHKRTLVSFAQGQRCKDENKFFLSVGVLAAQPGTKFPFPLWSPSNWSISIFQWSCH